MRHCSLEDIGATWNGFCELTLALDRQPARKGDLRPAPAKNWFAQRPEEAPEGPFPVPALSRLAPHFGPVGASREPGPWLRLARPAARERVGFPVAQFVVSAYGSKASHTGFFGVSGCVCS